MSAKHWELNISKIKLILFLPNLLLLQSCVFMNGCAIHFAALHVFFPCSLTLIKPKPCGSAYYMTSERPSSSLPLHCHHTHLNQLGQHLDCSLTVSHFVFMDVNLQVDLHSEGRIFPKCQPNPVTSHEHKLSYSRKNVVYEEYINWHKKMFTTSSLSEKNLNLKLLPHF